MQTALHVLGILAIGLVIRAIGRHPRGAATVVKAIVVLLAVVFVVEMLPWLWHTGWLVPALALGIVAGEGWRIVRRQRRQRVPEAGRQEAVVPERPDEGGGQAPHL